MLSIPLLRTWNARAELRRALLAAMESCWLYAIVLTLGTLANFPRVISPFGIFLVYMIGLYVGRLLPRSKRAWNVLQWLTVAFALLAIFVAMRVGFYTDAGLLDLRWLPTYLMRVMTIFERVTAEEISTIVLIVTFVRALGFAQRPLTLWVVGFQFRLGIVFFFFTAFVSAFTRPVNFAFWIFMYFAFSLVGISLARIEEAGREQSLGVKWALVIVTAIAASLLVGFAATQFLTLDAVNGLFVFLSPLILVLQVIITILALPFLVLFEALFKFISPYLRDFMNLLGSVIPRLNFSNQQPPALVNEAVRQLENLIPYFRLLGVIAVMLAVGWWIARTLNRRVKWREDEMFEREMLDARGSAEVEKRKRQRRTRPRPRELHAENIRRIYAALLAQAEALGLKRREAETPLEFLPRLTGRFPESAVDLQNITAAYVAAHYAEEQATEARVREVRARWQRTKEQMKHAAG